MMFFAISSKPCRLLEFYPICTLTRASTVFCAAKKRAKNANDSGSAFLAYQQ